MISASRIEELPEGWRETLETRDLKDLDAAATRKFDIIKHSTAVWLVSYDGAPVFFFGLIKGTMLGHRAELWFMPCKGMHKRWRKLVMFSRKGLRRIVQLYGITKCRVYKDFEQGQRFAEWLGFTRVGEAESYFVYEMRASWR